MGRLTALSIFIDPNLRHVVEMSASTVHSKQALQHMRDFPPARFIQSVQFSLQELVLKRILFQRDTVADALRTCPNLKRLTYGACVPGHEYTSLLQSQLDAVGDTLRQYGRNLTHLHLFMAFTARPGSAADRVILGFIGPLRELVSLRYLSITSGNLLGRSSYTNVDLAEYLPLSLEVLVFTKWDGETANHDSFGVDPFLVQRLNHS